MTEQIDLHIGARLRHRRRELNLSLADVGASVGLRYQRIHKYETGATRISASMLAKLTRALDVNPWYAFEGLSTPEPRSFAPATQEPPLSSPAMYPVGRRPRPD